MFLNVVVSRTCWQQSEYIGVWWLFRKVWEIFGCFLLCLFLYVVLCLYFFGKAIMGCTLFNISLKVMSMLKMCQCLLFLLYLTELGCMLTRMVLCLYIWVYNVLKVMIYPGGQLSRFVFLQSIHCSHFQQIFYYVLVMFPVFLKSWTYVLNFKCLTIRDTFFSGNSCADLECKLSMYINVSRNSIFSFENLKSNFIDVFDLFCP